MLPLAKANSTWIDHLWVHSVKHFQPSLRFSHLRELFICSAGANGRDYVNTESSDEVILHESIINADDNGKNLIEFLVVNTIFAFRLDLRQMSTLQPNPPRTKNRCSLFPGEACVQ